MNMYSVMREVKKNGVILPHYRTKRGSNSLESFHAHLPHMIPGDHCAAKPFQVYLLSGLARWNSDRASDAVLGQRGRQHMVFSSSLIHRLNTRCKELFGDEQVPEVNFRPPVPPGRELIGLEYLFHQSDIEFSVTQIPETVIESEGDDEVTTEATEEDPVVPDDGYSSEREEEQQLPVAVDTIRLTRLHRHSTFLLKTFVVEHMANLLVPLGTDDGKLSISPETRQQIVRAWEALDEHDMDS